VIMAPGRPAVPCVMRDVSDSGALLEVPHPEWLPRRFRLVIEAGDFQADCEIIRRTDCAVGVRFAVPTAFNVRPKVSLEAPEH